MSSDYDHPFDEGEEAFYDGLSIDDNPYCPDLDWNEYVEWEDGFETAVVLDGVEHDFDDGEGR